MKKYDTKALLDILIESVKEKKALNIVSLDLRELEQSICDYFIICEASSTIQVDAIAEFAEVSAKTALGEYSLHVEGRENAQWVLVDYGDIVLHVFLSEQRDFYKLDQLWADAVTTHHNDA